MFKILVKSFCFAIIVLFAVIILQLISYLYMNIITIGRTIIFKYF